MTVLTELNAISLTGTAAAAAQAVNRRSNLTPYRRPILALTHI
jgi:hypothetical protein